MEQNIRQNIFETNYIAAIKILLWNIKFAPGIKRCNKNNTKKYNTIGSHKRYVAHICKYIIILYTHFLGKTMKN